MTRSGGRKASEKISKIGAGATSRSVKAFQFKILIMLRKGNHPSEAYVRKGRRKALRKREKDSVWGLTRKHTYSLRPWDKGRTRPLAKKHV